MRILTPDLFLFKCKFAGKIGLGLETIFSPAAKEQIFVSLVATAKISTVLLEPQSKLALNPEAGINTLENVRALGMGLACTSVGHLLDASIWSPCCPSRDPVPANAHPGGQQEVAQICGSLPSLREAQMGFQAPDWGSPSLSIEGMWGVKQQMGDVYLSLSL